MQRNLKLWNTFGPAESNASELAYYATVGAALGAEIKWCIPGVKDFNAPLKACPMRQIGEATNLTVVFHPNNDEEVYIESFTPESTLLDIFRFLDKARKIAGASDHVFLEGFQFARDKKTDGSGWVSWAYPFFGS